MIYSTHFLFLSVTHLLLQYSVTHYLLLLHSLHSLIRLPVCSFIHSRTHLCIYLVSICSLICFTFHSLCVVTQLHPLTAIHSSFSIHFLGHVFGIQCRLIYYPFSLPPCLHVHCPFTHGVFIHWVTCVPTPELREAPRDRAGNEEMKGSWTLLPGFMQASVRSATGIKKGSLRSFFGLGVAFLSNGS